MSASWEPSSTPSHPRPSAASAAAAVSRVLRPALWAVGLLAAVALLHLRDPHESGSYLYCPWLLLTGTYCPGCGGLRAVNDLTNGDLGAALSSNLLVVVLIPVAVLLWAGWVRSRWRGQRFTSALFAPPVLWSLLAVVLAFGLLRNLGFAAWLAP